MVNKCINIMTLLSVLMAGRCVAAISNDTLLKDARAYLEKGEIKSAVIQLKNLLQAAPEHAEARLMIGEAYLQLGNADSAVKEIERARDLNIGKEKWLVPLSRAYLLQGKPKLVLEKIHVDESLPEKIRGQLHALRGMAFTAIEQAQSAQESFNAALKSDPENSDALLGLAMLSLQKSRFDEAIDYVNQVIAKNDKKANAWVILGEIKRLQGDQQAALDAFSTAVELSPVDIRARLGRAIVYIGQGKLDAAQNDVNQARKIARDVPLALYLHGVIAFQNKNFEDAEDALLKATNLLPNHLPSQLLLGTIAYTQNKFESAERYLSQYTASVPNHLPAVKLLAATRMRQNHAAPAIEILKSVEDKAQNDAQFLALLGSAYMQNKQFDLGTDHLNRAAELAPDIAAIHAQLALGHIASGKMDEAIGNLKHAVDLGQGLVQADIMLVLALTQQKKYDEAIIAARRLSEKMPSDPMSDNLIGMAYMARGDFQNAQAHWQNALKINPNYFLAALNLAQLEAKRDHWSAASERYRTVLEQNAGNLAAHIGLAQIAEKQKDYAQMVDWLEKARDKNPKSLEPALMLSRYYLAQGKTLPALNVARAAQSNNPDNPLALENLGFAQLSANQGANAAITFKRLIGEDAGNPHFHYLLGQALYRVGNKRDAIAEWNEALRLKADYVPAAVAQAEVALKDRQYGEVIKLAREIQLMQPKASIGLQLEGDARFAQKQFKQAHQSYEKAYQIDKTSPLVRRLFQTKRELADNAAALEILNKWLEKNSEDVESWLALALACQQDGKKKEAIEAYEKITTLMPDNLLVNNNLAWLYQEAGDNRAAQLAEKILTLTENNPEVLDTAGWIFLSTGKVDRGLVILQQAAILAPNVPQIRMHLAEGLSRSGRKEEARKELNRLLSEKKNFTERARAEAMLDTISP